MTRDKAVEITRALNDIDDFELFMDLVSNAYREVEGNISGFFHDELMPLMKKELRRRESVLEEM